MRRALLIGAVLSAGVYLYGCGGGGGGSTTGSTTPVLLYFTDDASIYPVVEVTIHEVNLCKDPTCTDKVNLFQSADGLSIDLTNLNGVLQYVDTSNVPAGSYPRLEIVLSQNATICDNSGVCHDARMSR